MTTVAERVDNAGDHERLLTALHRQRSAFVAEGPPTVAVRRDRIDRLTALMLDNADAIVEAMSADYGTRPRPGALFTEIMGALPVIEHTRSHVAAWTRSTTLLRSARWAGLRAEVEPVPVGVVGIVGPWNFPVNLVILPAAAAFAAGNRVMIKMSEITAHTAELLSDRAPEYFDDTELTVVTGGPDTAAAFTALPFDHLFFTGSPTVGASVQRAAAANLVPVTLELGGKNPVVVGPRADLRRAAVRIAQGRMVNGGQVCVCPDYVLVADHLVDAFSELVLDTWRRMFPSIVTNDDYCSSVNDANFDRVVGLIDDARSGGARVDSVVPPGELLPDRVSRKIAPTVIRDVAPTMRIASEEVFGPVLSVLGYSTTDEAVDHVNSRPAPLVAYWFGPDDRDFRTFVRRTRSGGVARNDFAAQMIPSAAPFGGVGRSGMGAYHGKAGFDTFSHHRSVVGSDLPFSITGSAAPPFGAVMRRSTEFRLRMARNRTRRRLRRSQG
ncbi:aldehyde dehydrogenase [Mycobacterium sp. IS-1742]|uniref:aldehyde dehydrogenase family protein n=1 Tax=Mycobacterium sp. IS-1742 TaxID=1772285 RepID=UPI00074031B0|nr:aldehyde dehydrogenase family protein [Mycobacterium sp. IS-1742]KUI24682.1 aldehyde dehydrogenase [Mycobacterium sp. IS-1742]